MEQRGNNINREQFHDPYRQECAAVMTVKCECLASACVLGEFMVVILLLSGENL